MTIRFKPIILPSGYYVPYQPLISMCTHIPFKIGCLNYIPINIITLVFNVYLKYFTSLYICKFPLKMIYSLLKLPNLYSKC